MFSLAIHSAAPDGYIDLVWDIFFSSRGRGRRLNRHFPWLDVPSPTTWYVVATSGDGVIGGLAVREDQDGNERLASIGLVCVHSAHRGQGLSGLLLAHGIAQARARGLAALRLWTTTPNVYRSHGFSVADTAFFGWIKRTVAASDSQLYVEHQYWPASVTAGADLRGLPPFAVNGHRWQCAHASVVALDDADGVIVAEWTGPARSVVQLMAKVLPDRLRLNAIENDELLDELSAQNWTCALARKELQMILPLVNDITAQSYADKYPIRLLSRI